MSFLDFYSRASKADKVIDEIRTVVDVLVDERYISENSPLKFYVDSNGKQKILLTAVNAITASSAYDDVKMYIFPAGDQSKILPGTMDIIKKRLVKIDLTPLECHIKWQKATKDYTKTLFSVGVTLAVVLVCYALSGLLGWIMGGSQAKGDETPVDKDGLVLAKFQFLEEKLTNLSRVVNVLNLGASEIQANNKVIFESKLANFVSRLETKAAEELENMKKDKVILTDAIEHLRGKVVALTIMLNNKEAAMDASHDVYNESVKTDIAKVQKFLAEAKEVLGNIQPVVDSVNVLNNQVQEATHAIQVAEKSVKDTETIAYWMTVCFAVAFSLSLIFSWMCSSVRGENSDMLLTPSHRIKTVEDHVARMDKEVKTLSGQVTVLENKTEANKETSPDGNPSGRPSRRGRPSHA
jgi:hypothetical protein